MKNTLHTWLQRLIVGALTACSLSAVAASDPVVLTFSTVGDSREDPTTPTLTAQDAIWLQNTKAWSRIIRSIQAQKPSLLFFNGDMIMGYGKASTTIGQISGATTATDITKTDIYKYGQQYGFWRGMVTSLQETGTYVVPVPGNHEVQSKASGKVAQVENENAWRSNMADIILDKSRFPFPVDNSELNFSGDASDATLQFPGTADGLATSQSKLSYSFDVADSHFIVINTDPVGKDGTAPTAWLSADMAAAKNRGARHFFVFGHKPAKPYVYAAGVSPSGLNTASAAAFWAIIEQYKATYFCGHEHTYNVSRPVFTVTNTNGTQSTIGGNAYQVIVGAGGSPFDVPANTTSYSPATDRSYSWATVQIHQSGLVDINTYGFDANFGPTAKFATVNLLQ